MIACIHCRELSVSQCRCDHCGATLKSCRSAQTALTALLGIGLVGCPPGPQPQPAYGVAETGFVDNDDDGFTVRDGDCDDADPNVHPEAAETVGDGIDSNCDGDDDT